MVLENESHLAALKTVFTEKKQQHFIQTHSSISDGRYQVTFLTSPQAILHAAILENLVEFNPLSMDVKTHFFTTNSVESVNLPEWIATDTAEELDEDDLIRAHRDGMPIQAWVSRSMEKGIKLLKVYFDADRFIFDILTTETPELVQSDLPFEKAGDLYNYKLILHGYPSGLTNNKLFNSEKNRCFKMLVRMNAGSHSFQTMMESFFEKIRCEITENTDPLSRAADFFISRKAAVEVAISSFLNHSPETLPPETRESVEQLKICCDPAVLPNNYSQRLAVANVCEDEVPVWMICALSGLIMDAPSIDRTTLDKGSRETVARVDYGFLIYSIISLYEKPKLTDEEKTRIRDTSCSPQELAEKLLAYTTFFSPLTRQPIDKNFSVADHDTLSQMQIDEFVVRKEIEAEWKRTLPKI